LTAVNHTLASSAFVVVLSVFPVCVVAACVVVLLVFFFFLLSETGGGGGVAAGPGKTNAREPHITIPTHIHLPDKKKKT